MAKFSFTPVSQEAAKPSFFTPAESTSEVADDSFLGQLQRKAQIAATGYTSGATGLPIDAIQAVLGAPAAAKAATTKLGITGEFTPEQQKYAETIGSIPGGSEYLYQNVGKGHEPESGLERYIKTISQRSGGGGAAGSVGGPLGIAAGSAAGAGFGAVEQTLKELGVADEYVGPIMLALGIAGPSIPLPKISKATKPSGLTSRQFEKVTKPTSVSSSRHGKITKALESDFREIGKDILSKNKTFSELQENPSLKKDVINMFGKVEQLAESIPETFNTADVQRSFNKRIKERPKTGYMKSEFEESLSDRVKEINKKFQHKEISARETVGQFRKNNEDLGELFEPGKSGASNRAKKEALLEHNRAIEDVFRDKFPDSEFTNLFEESNKYWSDLMDIDTATDYIDSIFKEKISYKNASKILDDKSVQRPFKKLLGEEGFKSFKGLVNDLMSTEKSYSLLKKGKEHGVSDLLRLGTLYGISPEAGTAFSLGKVGKSAFKSILDKPQIAIEWENAFSQLKRGKFSEAEKSFKKVEQLSSSQ